MHCASFESTPLRTGDLPRDVDLLEVAAAKQIHEFLVRVSFISYFIPAAFRAGEPVVPGTDSCFLTAGGVEESLLKGRTG
jgi:hypothetical protein